MSAPRPNRRFFLALLVWSSLAGSIPRASAAGRAALGDLARATAARDVEGFLSAAQRVLEDSRRGIRAVVEGYARLSASLEREGDPADRYDLHRRTAVLLSRRAGGDEVRELDRLRRRAKDWRSRVLLIDVAGLHRGLDLEKACLEALRDREPPVVRRALRYLSRGRKAEIVDAIVERYSALEAEEAKGRRRGRDERAASERSRTLLACRGALGRLLRVDLPSAADWKNWVEVHKRRGDLFRAPAAGAERGRTAVTLFGAAVTGKNIAFILDVSGSMLATDPPPEEQGLPRSGRTVVGTGGDVPSARERIDRRRRITRAKRELARVVRALPSDVRFNIIAYSSDVTPWSRVLVEASDEKKSEAVAFIEGLRAEGITVTDMAIEEAFSDFRLDTIYLLTDGAPTHVGTRGPGMPPDARELIARILARVKELNFLRDVRIFCLGFRGAEEEFLKSLASTHSGRYVRIR